MKTSRLIGVVALAIVLASFGVPDGPGASQAGEPPAGNTTIRECPDPSILMAEGNRYMFCTDGIVYTSSASELNWPSAPEQALSRTDWAPRACRILWAPDVIEAAGQYVMVYTSNWQDPETGECHGKPSGHERRCLFVAVSSTPEGPYHSPADPSIACNPTGETNFYAGQWFLGAGGSSAPYIVAKKRTPGLGSKISVHKMRSDLLALDPDKDWQDTPLKNDRAWEENGTLEGPAFLRLPKSGYWVLFYSAGKWDGDEDTYAMGYAYCGNGNVPSVNECTKPPSNKLVTDYGQSHSLGAGMAYSDASGNINLVAAGPFGEPDPASCTQDCNPRYARIFRLAGVNGTGVPTGIAIDGPALQ